MEKIKIVDYFTSINTILSNFNKIIELIENKPDELNEEADYDPYESEYFSELNELVELTYILEVKVEEIVKYPYTFSTLIESYYFILDSQHDEKFITYILEKLEYVIFQIDSFKKFQEKISSKIDERKWLNVMPMNHGFSSFADIKENYFFHVNYYLSYLKEEIEKSQKIFSKYTKPHELKDIASESYSNKKKILINSKPAEFVELLKKLQVKGWIKLPDSGEGTAQKILNSFEFKNNNPSKESLGKLFANDVFGLGPGKMEILNKIPFLDTIQNTK